MVCKVQSVQSTNNDTTGKYKTYSGNGRPSGQPGPSNFYRLFPHLVGTAIIDRLIEIGTCYEMESYVERMKEQRQPPVHVMPDQEDLVNVEYLNYWGGMITNDARCTGENKSRIFTELTWKKQNSARKRLYLPAN